jgi:predicted nucleotidyltransferase
VTASKANATSAEMLARLSCRCPDGPGSCIISTMARNRRIDEILDALRQVKPDLESRYQVEQLGVFGSVVKGRGRTDSDLDILVTFRKPPSLLQFVKLENELSDRLGVKVDLVMREALKPRIGERILQEIVPV